jgi:O-antigen/teichoic acid export membrane protein
LWTVLLRTGVRPQWPFDKTIAWPLLLNSAPLALNAFLALAYQHADKLMTTHFIGESGTGYLTAAFVVVFGVIEILSTTVLVATFPMMSRYYGSDTFGFIVEKLSFFTALVSLPLSLVLGLFAADIIVPVLGEDWRPTSAILSILIWYTLLTMIGNVYAQAMMAQNRQRLLLGIRVSGLVINLTLNLILLPQLGVRGAALATLCAEIVVLSLMLLSFRAQGWERARVLSRFARLAVLGLAVGLCMLLIGKIHPLLGIVGGLGLYIAGVLFGRTLADDDWDLLYRLAAAMPGGSLLLRYWKRDTAIHW